MGHKGLLMIRIEPVRQQVESQVGTDFVQPIPFLLSDLRG